MTQKKVVGRLHIITFLFPKTPRWHMIFLFDSSPKIIFFALIPVVPLSWRSAV
jgi:hypothetical protein